jgi:hypothetical protein
VHGRRPGAALGAANDRAENNPASLRRQLTLLPRVLGHFGKLE